MLLLISCKQNEKEVNCIPYYTKVNKIDSIYRISDNPVLAAKEYEKLFKEYSPKNQEFIEEYETYIKLSDQYRLDFAGKENLYKLITLLEPSGNKYKRYLPLLKKYGIDETEVKRRIDRYKSGLDPILIDSLTLASRRDQEVQRMNTIIMHRNDKKNLNLFLKIFDQYGYPSEEKAGTTGNDGEPLIIITILSHLICLDYNKIYPRLNEFLKKGKILPRTFALIVDKYYLCENKNGYYNVYGKSSNKDSVIINNSRKRIGLPTLTHYAKIRRDYFNSSR